MQGGLGLPQRVCSRVARPCCHALRPRHLGAAESPQPLNRAPQRQPVIRRGFGDDLLDFIEGTSSGHCVSLSVRRKCLAALSPATPPRASLSCRGNELEPRLLSMQPCSALDMLAAGPKLRKWYGEGERMPKDGGGSFDDGEADTSVQIGSDVPRTAILVTDADSPLAEQVVLQLILARCRALC